MPKPKKENKTEDWREKFDDLKVHYVTPVSEFNEPLGINDEQERVVKNFISNLLKAQKEELKKKVERMKRDELWEEHLPDKDKQKLKEIFKGFKNPLKTPEFMRERRYGFNQAINEFIKLLDEE